MKNRISILLVTLAVIGTSALAAETTPVPPTPPTDGLLSEYRFETDANDSSGQNHHGKVHGNPRFATVDGRAGLVLDGTGDWVETDLKLPEPRNEVTFECWVRPGAQQVPYADIFGYHTHAGVGFALQQNGSNTNSYAFAYSNGAGGWIGTKTIQLADDHWQHVAIVKSSKELKFYLNGVLLDSVAATLPLVEPSPMSFRIGLGFDAESRCLNGVISGFRIWNRALTEIKPEVTAEQTFEALANNTSVRLSAALPSRIFGPTHPPAIDVSFVEGAMPKSEGMIKAAFECEDFSGKKIGVSPVELTSQGGFKQTLRLPLPQGYYRLTCKPTVVGQNFQIAMQPATISFAVQGDAAVKALPVTSPKTATLGAQPTRTLSLDGEDWLLATDPQNVGRTEQWFNAPTKDAKPTKVPWIIQDVFTNYHGVAWYWRDFPAPANPHDNGRFILRFWAVDYLAEVWVNGVRIGQHEGSEDPFEFDVTSALKPGQTNRLAVRVLNPTKEGVDGIALEDTARSYRTYPVTQGTAYNVGGIVDSVELLATPVARVENIYAKPNWKTGEIDIEVNVRNASAQPVNGTVRLSVAPAQNGETLDAVLLTQQLPPGDTLVRARLQVAKPRLWNLEDPFLYRVSATVAAEGSVSFDEKSTRCGFRDFRYENDAFRLNGKRIYLQGSLLMPTYPVGFVVPSRADYLRRDLVASKAMGLNTIRVIWGGLRARDLDVFDEMGVLVWQEHYGSTWINPTPELDRRFDASLSGVIRRDRNHPSIVIWCLLNESGMGGINQAGTGGMMNGGPLFRHAVQSLPLVKSLDDTRLVLLNSGGHDMQFGQGSLSNPGATEWQFLMGSEAAGKPGYANYWAEFGAMMGNAFDIKADVHAYQSVPFTVAEIQRMRTLGARANGRKIIISEIGTAGALNLPRFARHYEQMGAEYTDDARFYRKKLDQFLADWKKWDLSRVWTRPEDYFTDSGRNMVRLCRETGNALRANPYLAGYTFCALTGSGYDGDGMLNDFRELLPGVVDLQNDLTSPVRWCLFAEPVSIYRGGKLKLEAILSNLDALRAGDYPIHIEVVAPDGHRVFEEKLTLTIPALADSAEPPLVKEVFSREVPVNGPAGTYKFLVSFERGAAATGGEITFNVFDPAAMPAVNQEVVLWGKDDGLGQWLSSQKIPWRPFSGQSPGRRELILVGNGGGDLPAFRELVSRMAAGATVVFLSPSVFARGDKPLAFLPLAAKGSLINLDFVAGYYRGDAFAPRHPVFDGLPAGGVLDYTLYRNIIPQGGYGFAGMDVPSDLIVGNLQLSYGYASNIQMAAYNFGSGSFVINTLHIRECLGSDPVAERLLRNLLNYAARDLDKPVAELPADFEKQLKAIGYN